MRACHWKAHNTFTNFYLKDLTWSDNDNNLYLGSVVAAKEVLDPSPEHPHLREEKKGGGHASLQESFPGSRYQLPIQMFTVMSFYILLYNVFQYSMYLNLIFKWRRNEIQD